MLDKLIEHDEIQRKRRRRETRATFRHAHHYFSYLKYWNSYEAKFAYLDSKSQGLVAVAGILTAVFLLLITYTLDRQASTAIPSKLAVIVLFLSFSSLISVVASQIILMRCFSTTGGGNFKNHDAEARKIEDLVKAKLQDGQEERTRVLESHLDSFLSLHLKMIQSVDKDHQRLQEKLKGLWGTIRKDPYHEFKDFDNRVSDFMGRLRDAIEGEINVRHRNYHAARSIVLASLYSLLAAVVLVAIERAGLLNYFFT